MADLGRRSASSCGAARPTSAHAPAHAASGRASTRDPRPGRSSTARRSSSATPAARPSGSRPSSTSSPRSAASASIPDTGRLPRGAGQGPPRLARPRAAGVVEDQLKRGDLRAIVATSSLELGIDMGAVDLVIQVEIPGRGQPRAAAHRRAPATRSASRAGARSSRSTAATCSRRPSSRGGCSTAQIESTHYLRNPLDVLAQQIVAHTAARGETPVDELAAMVRRSANFADLSDEQLGNTLDLLAGRYPSEEFAELRPRLVWDRVTDTLRARDGSEAPRRHAAAARSPTAGCSACSCPTASGSASSTRRWCTRAGPARRSCSARRRGASRTSRSSGSSSRRRRASPARCRSGTATGPGGRSSWAGRSARSCASCATLDRRRGHRAAARRLLARPLAADEPARSTSTSRPRRPASCPTTARSSSSASATRSATGGSACSPRSARRCTRRGRWRSSSGSTERHDLPVESMWGDDGIVLRLPEHADELPLDALLIDPDEIDELVVATPAADVVVRRRASASAPGGRCCCRAAAPTSAPRCGSNASGRPTCSPWRPSIPTFPILLETTRECLQDVFDVPALREVLGQLRSRARPAGQRRHRQAEPVRAEPAVQLDRRLHVRGRRTARRAAGGRAGARPRPAARPARSRGAARAARSRRARRRRARPAAPVRRPPGPQRRRAARRPARRSATSPPSETRPAVGGDPGGVARPSSSPSGGRSRSRSPARPGSPRPTMPPACATRSAARCRSGCRRRSPSRCRGRWRICRALRPHPRTVRRARGGRPARHPRAERSRARWRRSRPTGRVVRGEFRPDGVRREWCDIEVLRQLRRRSLAALRREVEPVEQEALARFLPEWHGIPRAAPRRRTPWSRRSGCCRARRSSRPRSSTTCSPPGSTTTARASSTSCARPAMSCGSGPGRSGRPTAGCGSCFADQLPLLAPGLGASGSAAGRAPRRHPGRARPSAGAASGTSCAAAPGASAAELLAAVVGSRLGGGGHQRLAAPLRRDHRIVGLDGRRGATSSTAVVHVPAGWPASVHRPAPVGGAWSPRCSNRCRHRPRPLTPRPSSSSSATAWSPVRPCSPRAWSAGTRPCTGS